MATLGEQAVGSIVKLNVGGTARNFIVVHQGLPGTMYDSSCDGTWLLMEDLYESRAWHSSSSNSYSASSIHSYLNSTFLNLLDSDIKSAVKTVKLPYTNGTGTAGSVASGSSGLSAQVFLLSYTEVGFSGSSYANVEGAVLSYFNGAANSKRVAYLNGISTMWTLRSPYTNGTIRSWAVSDQGSINYPRIDASNGIRPALVLPTELSVTDDGTVTLSSAAITGQVNIGGVMRELTGEGYINIGGVLRPLVDSYANINGVLCSLRDFQKLPAGYTQVEYISATGTQYIDTGFDLTSNSRIVIDMDVTAASDQKALFGSRTASNAGFVLFTYNNNEGYQSDYNTQQLHPVGGTSSGRHTIDKNREKLYQDGVLVCTHTVSSFSTGYPAFLFSINKAGVAMSSYNASGRIYSCQIYESDVLVRDFVPCTNPSSVAGLYDLVGGAFYTNQGSGTFGSGT